MRKYCSIFEKILIKGIPKDWGLLKTVYENSSAALAFIRSDGVKVIVLISCDESLTGKERKVGFFSKCKYLFMKNVVGFMLYSCFFPVLKWFFSNKTRFWKSF